MELSGNQKASEMTAKAIANASVRKSIVKSKA
jgi:hypothetical protein